MRRTLRSLALMACLVFTIAACSGIIVPLSKSGVLETAWQALEPNTTSHDRAAWEAVQVEAVSGRDVLDLFAGEPVPGNCAPGPIPPDNADIDPEGAYWYVLMRPLPATSMPVPGEQWSPTAPPARPEPFLFEAHILIDAGSGQVVASKLYCVIY